MNILTFQEISFLNDRFLRAKHTDFDDFLELSKAEELHFLATYCTELSAYKGTMIDTLHWIQGSPLCCKSTALLIYWRSNPARVFSIYNSDNTLHNTFNLIQQIQKKFLVGFYASSEIAYNPINDWGRNLVAENLIDVQSNWQIPGVMKEQIEGLEFPDYFEMYAEKFFFSFPSGEYNNDDDDNSYLV